MDGHLRRARYNLNHEMLRVLVCSFIGSSAAYYQAHFEHGVASGDPSSDSIVIWTRVTPALSLAEQPAPESLSLEVSWFVWFETDNTLVQTGVFTTNGTRDWTVKHIVCGLVHSTPYLYNFTIGAAASPTGRFSLPPPAGVHLDSLHYAVFSCSSWAWGYFNAFGAAARRSAVHRRLDFWLHVGDYFYEDGQEQSYPRADQAVRWTGLQPATETLTLRDYRLRHALTRTDVDLQAISEAAPLIAVWDDHEITNDPWVGGAQAHNPENGEGDWWVRKRAAVKAYHEWMPTRIEPPPACTTNAASVAASAAEISMCTGTHEGERIYRQFRFGTLAALFMLETRLLARAEQAFDG